MILINTNPELLKERRSLADINLPEFKEKFEKILVKKNFKSILGKDLAYFSYDLKVLEEDSIFMHSVNEFLKKTTVSFHNIIGFQRIGSFCYYGDYIISPTNKHLPFFMCIYYEHSKFKLYIPQYGNQWNVIENRPFLNLKELREYQKTQPVNVYGTSFELLKNTDFLDKFIRKEIETIYFNPYFKKENTLNIRNKIREFSPNNYLLSIELLLEILDYNRMDMFYYFRKKMCYFELEDLLENINDIESEKEREFLKCYQEIIDLEWNFEKNTNNSVIRYLLTELKIKQFLL